MEREGCLSKNKSPRYACSAYRGREDWPLLGTDVAERGLEVGGEFGRDVGKMMPRIGEIVDVDVHLVSSASRPMSRMSADRNPSARALETLRRRARC